MDLASDINIENTAPLAVARNPANKQEKHHKLPEDCQNCGAKITGEYCHVCGQHSHVHRSVLHVIEEVFHGITHFDSRTWRSLPMLAFRPGTLTRNYVMGQRVRYVPPFAMFLFSIFAMFLVFAFSGGPNFVTVNTVTKAERVESAREAVVEREKELQEAQTELLGAQKELADLRALANVEPVDIEYANGDVRGAQGQVAAAQTRLSEAKVAEGKAIAAPEQTTQSNAPALSVNSTLTSDSIEEKRQVLADLRQDKARAEAAGNGLEVSVVETAIRAANSAPIANDVATSSKDIAPKSTAKAATTEVNVAEPNESIMDMMKESMRRGDFIRTPWPELNEKIKHKTENPDLFLYKIQNTAYKFSFLLVPLSLPFIWIMLFWKRDVTMFDHAVFALYSLSFVSFLFLFVSLSAHWLPIGTVSGVAATLLPVHIFFQFKGAYQLKWFSAFWRTALFCGIFSWVVILAFFLTIIALGVTG